VAPADADGSTTSGLVSRAETPAVVVELGAESAEVEADASGSPLADQSAAVRAASAGVDRSLVEALDRALDDERKGQRFYELVLERFGDRRPFSNIVHGEARHASAVLGLYGRLGVVAPPNAWAAGPMDVPETFVGAAEAAAAWERENVAMYEELLNLPAVAERDEVVRVFEHLRWASRERHLPAFERAATRGERGRGRGRGAGGAGGRRGEGRPAEPAPVPPWPKPASPRGA
jgi:rubrerythrin